MLCHVTFGRLGNLCKQGKQDLVEDSESGICCVRLCSVPSRTWITSRRVLLLLRLRIPPCPHASQEIQQRVQDQTKDGGEAFLTDPKDRRHDYDSCCRAELFARLSRLRQIATQGTQEEIHGRGSDIFMHMCYESCCCKPLSKRTAEHAAELIGLSGCAAERVAGFSTLRGSPLKV